MPSGLTFQQVQKYEKGNQSDWCKPACSRLPVFSTFSPAFFFEEHGGGGAWGAGHEAFPRMAQANVVDFLSTSQKDLLLNKNFVRIKRSAKIRRKKIVELVTSLGRRPGYRPESDPSAPTSEAP